MSTDRYVYGYNNAIREYYDWPHVQSIVNSKVHIKADSSNVRVRQIVNAEEADNNRLPDASVAGQGLFASTDIQTTNFICEVDQPALSALDTPRLKDTCYHCFAQVADQGKLNKWIHTASNRSAITSNTGLGVAREREGVLKLKVCKGCNVVRYCDHTCQSESWEIHHKLECSIFAALYPRVLPNNVRAAIRWFLQREKGFIPVNLIADVDQLESHVDDLRNTGGKKWADLVLMAQGTKEYSGTKFSFNHILEFICKLMINSFALMTSWNDPIGLAMHPLLAKMNHSCLPNAYVRFSVKRSGSITVVPLQKINKGEEITVPYIDPNEFFIHRQQQLKERYFFQCKCVRCKKNKNAESVDQEVRSKNLQHLLGRVDELIEKAENTTSNSSRIESLRYAIFLLEDTKVWKMKQEPYPKLIHKLILAYVSAQQFNLALTYAALQYIDIDPLVYKQDFHPVRTSHAFVFVRLMNLALDNEDWSTQEIDLTSERFRGLNLGWWRDHVIRELHKSLSKTFANDLKEILRKEGSVVHPTVNHEKELEKAKDGMRGLITWAVERNRVWK